MLENIQFSWSSKYTAIQIITDSRCVYVVLYETRDVSTCSTLVMHSVSPPINPSMRDAHHKTKEGIEAPIKYEKSQEKTSVENCLLFSHRGIKSIQERSSNLLQTYESGYEATEIQKLGKIQLSCHLTSLCPKNVTQMPIYRDFHTC